MTISVYCVFDLKAKVNDVPFFHRNDATAQRYFAEMVNHDDHPYNKNPEDFSLWLVGTFDQAERLLEGELPKLLAEGLHLRNQMHE